MTALVHLPDELNIGLREMLIEDMGYILKSWKETMKRSPSMRWARDPEIYRALNVRCDKLLETHSALVACNPEPEHEKQIIGWACIDREANVAHYVYVLKPYRRNGVARILLSGLQEPISCSQWSADCEWLQAHIKLAYRPSLADPQ